MVESALLTLFAALIGRALAGALPGVVRGGGAALVRANFRGEEIPAAQGISFVLAAALTVFASLPLGVAGAAPVAAFVFGLTAMGLVGLLDDVAGTGESRGFRGHLGRLWAGGGLSTGALKALFGGAVALAVSSALTSSGAAPLALGTAVIALSTNAVNLFDVRPGRAAKLYLAASLALLAAAPELGPFVLPLSAAVAVYLPEDLAGRAMMGDAGANALGFALGFCAVVGTGPAPQIALLAALVALHAAAERTSLGAWIERLPVVRSIDAWGRADGEGAAGRGERVGGEREGGE